MSFGLIGAYGPYELGTIRPPPVHRQHSRDAPTGLVFSISTAECPPDEIASERSAACAGTRFPRQAAAVALPSVPAAQRRSERTASPPQSATYEAHRLES